MLSTNARVSSAPSSQLDLPGSSSRLVGLLREREKLLAKVAAKKRKVDDMVEQLEARKSQAAQMSAALAPLFAQAKAIDGEIHALFASLLARKDMKREDRRIIREVHVALQNLGIITIDTLDMVGAFDPPPDGCAEGALPPPGPDGESPSAKRPAGGKATAIRELFRRLASAIHPDKAPDGSQQERTEAMKEVTRAYQDGDLARLLELEKAWLAGDVAEACGGEDDSERRCANLESTNRELTGQLKTLDKRLRDLRNQAPLDLMSALGFAPRRGDTACSDVEAMIGEQLESLRQARDYVQSFADGKITIEKLVAGPGIDSANDDLADELTFEVLSDLLVTHLNPSGRDRPRPRSARRRRRR